MNDEIKEILDDLLFTTTLPNVSVKLSEKKLNQLKDYITNLQQENEILKEHLKAYKKDGDETQERIDKAIEYIENLPVMFYPDDFYENNHKEIEWDRTELLDILKGDSNE